MSDKIPNHTNDDADRPDNGGAVSRARAPHSDRDNRLKTALKANLARRKAQTRARKAPTDPKD